MDSIVRGKYIGTVDDEKLTDSTIAGYIAGLGDKYAYYMDAGEYDEYLLENTSGVKTGIGISVVYDNTAGGLYITNVYEDTPAAHAGILPGEVIARVDGKSVLEMGLQPFRRTHFGRRRGKRINFIRPFRGRSGKEP